MATRRPSQHWAADAAPSTAALPRWPATEGVTRATPGPSSAALARRRWRSAELFGSQQEIEIEHGEVLYRLRLTSLGKLILTK